MKILKKAEQKNFLVNRAYYTDNELENLFNNGYLFFITVDDSDNKDYRISQQHIKEIKVILDEYGFYTNVAVLNIGTEIYVEL